MPDDPVTIGELARRIEQGFADIKEDVHDIGRRLDGKVSADVYEVKHNGIVDRIAAIEQARKDEQKDRAAEQKDRVIMRRWVIAAILIPVVTAGAQIVLAVTGG